MIVIEKCLSSKDIASFIFRLIQEYFGAGKITASSRVFVKPNANSNMNALTGNTTDLRILSAIIRCLKDSGIKNISLGDGTNSGYYREKIDVLERLRIKALAKYFNIELVDLNYSPAAVEIPLENGVITHAASIIRDADFFINVPKIKMHYETLMSCCLKNLMGTLKGRENKKKIHDSLYKNIVNLNKVVKAHLHIVDGLISMEGNGPSSGTPIKTDVILAGENPWEQDAAAAGIAGIGWEEVPVLAESCRQGLVSKAALDSANIEGRKHCIRPFLRPHNNPIVALVTNKKLQKYFLKVRYAPGIRQLANSKPGKRFMNLLGVSQEVFVFQEPKGIRVVADKERINAQDMERYKLYCPRLIESPEEIGDKACLKCLYCFSTDPEGKITVAGKMGFFAQQEKQYGKWTRNLGSSGNKM